MRVIRAGRGCMVMLLRTRRERDMHNKGQIASWDMNGFIRRRRHIHVMITGGVVGAIIVQTVILQSTDSTVIAHMPTTCSGIWIIWIWREIETKFINVPMLSHYLFMACHNRVIKVIRVIGRGFVRVIQVI